MFGYKHFESSSDFNSKTAKLNKLTETLNLFPNLTCSGLFLDELETELGEALGRKVVEKG